jgi:hypothetical protein
MPAMMTKRTRPNARPPQERWGGGRFPKFIGQ